MAVAVRAFLDTSILVAGTIDFGDKSRFPQRVLDAVAEGRVQADYERWMRRNRMAQSFRTYTGHAWQSIISENTMSLAVMTWLNTMSG